MYPERSNFKMFGHKEHKEIPPFLKTADVLVLPNSAKKEVSVVSTSPMKLFEYMASGRPIVASDLPSIREILDESSAVLSVPDDSESLAKSIRLVLEDEELGEALAKKALERVKEYSWDSRARSILDFISDAS